MARGEQDERPRDPAREHPVNKAIQSLSRQGFGTYYARCIGMVPTEQRKASEKEALLEQLDGVRAMIAAL